jgi:hypothetical protein
MGDEKKETAIYGMWKEAVSVPRRSNAALVIG